MLQAGKVEVGLYCNSKFDIRPGVVQCHACFHRRQAREWAFEHDVVPLETDAVDCYRLSDHIAKSVLSRRFVAQECGEIAKDAPDVGKLLDRDMSASSLFQTVMRGADAALGEVLYAVPRPGH